MVLKRTEYPRPQFVRKDWLCLNGTWDFSFDDEGRSAAEHWERDSHTLDRQIQVPFCFESKLSGIHDTSIHDRMFYKRSFTVTRKSGKDNAFSCTLRLLTMNVLHL